MPLEPRGDFIAQHPTSDEPPAEAEPPKCQGIFGWLFGHKFYSLDRYFDWCQRCGYRP